MGSSNPTLSILFFQPNDVDATEYSPVHLRTGMLFFPSLFPPFHSQNPPLALVWPSCFSQVPTRWVFWNPNFPVSGKRFLNPDHTIPPSVTPPSPPTPFTIDSHPSAPSAGYPTLCSLGFPNLIFLYAIFSLPLHFSTPCCFVWDLPPKYVSSFRAEGSLVLPFPVFFFDLEALLYVFPTWCSFHFLSGFIDFSFFFLLRLLSQRLPLQRCSLFLADVGPAFRWVIPPPLLRIRALLFWMTGLYLVPPPLALTTDVFLSRPFLSHPPLRYFFTIYFTGFYTIFISSPDQNAPLIKYPFLLYPVRALFLSELDPPPTPPRLRCLFFFFISLLSIRLWRFRS